MFDMEALREMGRIARSFEPLAVPFLLGFSMAGLLTRWSMPLARRLEAQAIPSDRSLHAKPTPRLGGLGIGVAVLAGVILLELWPRYEPALAQLRSPQSFVTLILLGGGLALVAGLLDDLFSLSPRLKLILQALVGLVVFVPLGSEAVSYLDQRFVQEQSSLWWRFIFYYLSQFNFLTAYPQQLLIIAVLFCFFWIIASLNVSNFMDGADGQAALFGATQAIFYIAIFASAPLAPDPARPTIYGPFMVAFFLLVLGATLGFLVYNFPSADTFLGDSGSHFLGFLWGLTALYVLAHAGFASISTEKGRRVLVYGAGFAQAAGLLIAQAPHLYDAFLTLGRRALRRERLTQAHREHLYQRLILSGLSHRTLLALHAPYYLWNALMGFIVFHPIFPFSLKALAALMAVNSWIAYTRYVWAREKAAAAREE
jgi:UDP-GlcNAc:undecaprenyl-phosphate GlcNAc-1-phosphate transferase